MVDVLTKKQRSFCMSRIRAKNTRPEIILRKALGCSGIRGYRLHYQLTGKPDIVFPSRKVVIFVDGCFWHKCPKCFKPSKTRKSFWIKKLASNVVRDRVVNHELKKRGWIVLRFWEHDLKKMASVTGKILKKLNDG
ncbi:MAG: very short patch repair endonuclease [Candidatus Omnitrophota bacterium]